MILRTWVAVCESNVSVFATPTMAREGHGPSMAICWMLPDGVQRPRSARRDRFDVQQVHARRFRAPRDVGRSLRAHRSLAAPPPEP